MKDWTLRAPLWTVYLAQVPILVFVMGVVRLLFGHNFISALSYGLIQGSLFAAIFMWPTTVERRKFVATLTGPGRSDKELRAVEKAVRNGPVPNDPELRAAAQRLLQLRRMDATSLTLTAVTVSLLAGSAAWLAMVATPSWWLAVALSVVAGLAATAHEMRQQREASRRLDLAQEGR